jgi:hypothetical protein
VGRADADAIGQAAAWLEARTPWALLANRQPDGKPSVMARILGVIVVIGGLAGGGVSVDTSALDAYSA